jgi:hypothetical protein
MRTTGLDHAEGLRLPAAVLRDASHEIQLAAETPA